MTSADETNARQPIAAPATRNAPRARQSPEMMPGHVGLASSGQPSTTFVVAATAASRCRRAPADVPAVPDPARGDGARPGCSWPPRR